MRNREKFLEQSRVKEAAFWEKEGMKAAQEYHAAIQERENKLNESRKKRGNTRCTESGLRRRRRIL